MQAWSCPAVQAGVRGDIGRGGRAFPPSHPHGAIPVSEGLGTGHVPGSLRTVVGAEPRLKPRSSHPGPCLPDRLCSEGQRLKCRPRGWGEQRPPGPLRRRCVGSRGRGFGRDSLTPRSQLKGHHYSGTPGTAMEGNEAKAPSRAIIPPSGTLYTWASRGRPKGCQELAGCVLSRLKGKAASWVCNASSWGGASSLTERPPHGGICPLA